MTGAGGGIGQATVVALAQAGANVVCVDIDADQAERAAVAGRDAGGGAIPLATDISTEEGCEAMVAAAIKEWGRVDILHNNAAHLVLDSVVADQGLVEVPPEVFDRVMAVNVRGPYLGCRAAIPKMIAGGGGVVVNTSSVYSMLGDAGLGAYSTSKGALNALTRHVATAYGRQGIRCNAIVVGVAATPIMNLLLETDQVQSYIKATLTGRPVELSEIGAAVVFLSSDAAASITGQLIPIDGGHTVHAPWWSPGSEGSVIRG